MVGVRTVDGPMRLPQAVLLRAPIPPNGLHTREILFRDAYKPLSMSAVKPKVTRRTPLSAFDPRMFNPTLEF